MKILSSVPFLLLTYQLLLTTATGSYYTTIRNSNSDIQPINLFQLQCRAPISLNIPDGTKWLFNGSNYTMNPCFAGAVLVENRLTFNHTSDCDGYIQCGNGTEYSLPVQLLAKPEYNPFHRPEQLNIKRPQGSSVTLPCNVIVSAIGGLNVRWKQRLATSDNVKILKELNEDYSITLTNLELTPISTFYSCEVVQQAAITRGRNFRLTVIEYSPPHIIDFTPTSSEDKIRIVVTANGTNLKFSWFLDDNELYDNTNGIEINNKNNGMQSTLQLSNNIVTSIKNLRAFASNIDSTDSSDLRGMGSEVVRNRSDSVELWLYPVTVFPSISTVNLVPSTSAISDSDSKCEEMIVGLSVLSFAFAFVLVVMIVVVSLLCYKLFTTRNLSKTIQNKLCKSAQDETSIFNSAQDETSIFDSAQDETSTSNNAQIEAPRSENTQSTVLLCEETPQNPQTRVCVKEEFIDLLYKLLCEAIKSPSFIKKHRNELRGCREKIEKIMDELDYPVADCGKGPQGESSNPKPDMHEKYKNMHECIKKLLDEE